MSTDKQPVTSVLPSPRPVWMKLLIILTGVAFLLPGACGGLFYGAALWEWVSSGFRFKTGHDNYTVIIPVFAVPSILGSIVALGLLMRVVKIKSAPTVSLFLAGIATATILLSYFVFRSAFSPMDMEDDVILIILALVAFGFVVLPPLQHWRSERMKTTLEQ